MLPRIFVVSIALLPTLVFAQFEGSSDWIKRASSNYVLEDTFGNQGGLFLDRYEIVEETGIAIGAPEVLNILGAIEPGIINKTGIVTVVTNDPAGYLLYARVEEEFMRSAAGDEVPGFSPREGKKMDRWGRDDRARKWGMRLGSDSTDIDEKWGINGRKGLWTGLSEADQILASRSSPTDEEGSKEIIQMRWEMDTSVPEEAVYQVRVVLTAASF